MGIREDLGTGQPRVAENRSAISDAEKGAAQQAGTVTDRLRVLQAKLELDGLYVRSNTAWLALDCINDLVPALKPLAFSDPENPPPGVAVEHWREAVLSARAALTRATSSAPGSPAQSDTQNEEVVVP